MFPSRKNQPQEAPHSYAAQTNRPGQALQQAGTEASQDGSASSHLRTRTRQVLFILASAASVRYLIWRAGYTAPPQAIWFFYVFLAAEFLGCIETMLFYFTAWRPTRRRSRPALAGRTVDVFITTYNEPVDLVRETALCAARMHYPHTTYILDDGSRPEMKRLADEFGCEYIARTSREHAKAGNLNNALAKTQGEFIVLLDADHVPQPNFIDETIGFFADPKVAIVQTPQDFYNLDSFQHRTDWKNEYAWQQQEFFFSVIEPGKDYWNSTLFCGSPAVVRRSAMQEIGGFATGTVTEDFHTSLRLEDKGYRLLYFNKTLARGLAPQTFGFFAGQWLRWGQGAMQILRQAKPFSSRSMTIAQKISFFSSVYFYWMSYQKLVYVLTPILALATGLLPLRSDLPSFLLYFGPYFVLNTLAAIWIFGGMSGLLLSEQFSLIKLHLLMKSALGLRKKERAFVVTPKTKGCSSNFWDVWPQLAILAAAGISIVMGIGRLPGSNSFTWWAFSLCLFWSSYYFSLTYPVVRRALRRHEARASYRFGGRLDVPIRFSTAGQSEAPLHRSYARNLNRHGLSITQESPMAKGTLLDLQIVLPEREVTAGGRVVRCDSFKVQKGVSRFMNGIQFERIADEDRDEISRYLLNEVAPKQGKWLRLTRISQDTTPTRPQTGGTSAPRQKRRVKRARAAVRVGKGIVGILVLAMLLQPVVHAKNDANFDDLGQRALDQNHLTAAIAYFQQALLDDPHDSTALRGMGSVKERQGQYSRAIDYYEQAVRADNHDFESWLALGRIHSWCKQQEASYQAYERALALRPDNVDAKLSYAEALSWDPRRRSDSIALYRDILAEQPELQVAENGLAQVLAWTGERREAESLYDQVLHQDPKNAQALLGKAEIAGWEERRLEARRLLKMAQEAAPSNARILGSLGSTEVHLGQYQNARLLAEQLKVLDRPRAIQLEHEIDNARRTYTEVSYSARRDDTGSSSNRYGSNSMATTISFPVSTRTRWTLRYQPTLYSEPTQRNGNSFELGLDAQPTARLRIGIMTGVDRLPGQDWDQTATWSVSFQQSDSLRLLAGIDRSMVTDSTHSAVGSLIDGTVFGRVRSNQATIGISAVVRSLGMDYYATASGGFYDGSRLDRNWRRGLDIGVGKNLRNYHPYIRLGYAMTVFSFTENQSFLPGDIAPLSHIGGYFSPRLFLNNVATLSMHDHMGSRANWSVEASLGTQHVQYDSFSLGAARLSGTFRADFDVMISHGLRMAISYDLLDAGVSYRRHQFSVGLRSYL